MPDRPSVTFEFGEFRLDGDTRVLRRSDGRTVPLTPKAFDILRHLVVHQGTLVGKDELMRAVWPDTAVEENNLTQNISQLRRLLGEGPGEHKYIVTVPGRGYQFVAAVKTPAVQDDRPSGTGAVSIAVLPFVNVTANPDDDFFGDALAEELMTALSRFESVRVAARTSAFSLKGKPRDIREIAERLNVQLVLEGSVRRSGSRLRVSAALVSARDGYNLWSERYEREMDTRDIFDVQDEITLAVVNALQVKLPDRPKHPLPQRGTENVEAHEFCLKGRFHLFRMTQAGIETGVRYFERAIEADPAYALAHVGLAHAYRMFGLSLEAPPGDVAQKSKMAALRALAIEDTLAEAHAVLAFTEFWYDWNWAEADAHFAAALRLNPTSADTLWMYAHLASTMGRHGEALSAMARARELDPLSGLIHAMEGQFLLHAGRVDDAIVRLAEARELDPQSRVGHLFAASAYIAKGQLIDAVAEARAARALTSSSTHALAYEAFAHGRLGSRTDAEALVERLLRLSRERYVPPYHIAMACHAIDARDDAFGWLERGLEVRDPMMVFLRADPKWRDLHADPRFTDVLARMQLARSDDVEAGKG